MATRVREYNFIVGPETSTLPDAGTPTDPADAITLQYADANYVAGKAPAADITALKAIGASARKDNDGIYIDSLNAWFTFDSASAATGDDIFVIQPTSGSGRWIRSNQNPSVAIAINSKEQGSTPATPASGFQKVYPKSDGKWYTLDDAGIETQLGSGSGSGGINYLSANPNAETDTSGWATFADAAAATPADMTGGSPNSTWTRSTSSPLRGLASFLWTKSGSANRQGEGVSYAFTMDSADVSKMIQISFDVDATDSSYADDELTVWIYDVTNATLIYPAFQKIKKAKYTYQTTFVASSSTSYRFGVYTSGTSTSNYTIKFDNFQVGPTVTSIATPYSGARDISSLITFTSLGTVTNLSAYSERIGSKIHIWGTAKAGTVTAAAAYINFSSLNININTNFYQSQKTTVGFLSRVKNAASGATIYDNTCNLFWKTGNNQRVGGGRTTQNDLIDETNSFNLSNDDYFWFDFSFEVAEYAGASVYLSSAQPEYSSNSGTWDADDSTNFAYGPSGQLMGGSLGSSRSKRVRFLTPIQSTDSFQVQFSTDRTCWVPASTAKVNNNVVIPGADSAGNISAGVYAERVSGSTTDVDVTFGRYVNIANDDSPATNWPSSNAYWRVVKIPGLVQVASPTTVKWQKKFVASDFSTNSSSITDIAFNNLKIGRTYRITSKITLFVDDDDQTAYVQVKNGSTVIDRLYHDHQGQTDALTLTAPLTTSLIFIATATDMTFVTGDFSGSGSLTAVLGDANAINSWAILEELSTHSQTTEWT